VRGGKNFNVDDGNTHPWWEWAVPIIVRAVITTPVQKLGLYFRYDCERGQYLPCILLMRVTQSILVSGQYLI
jgi:hypothetical protein